MLKKVCRSGRAPLGCFLLMLLLVFMALMRSCTQLELHLEALREVWDGHRLLTHVLCAPDTRLLLISLLLLPLLCWQLEEHLGTLCYLHLSCLCTLCCATVYILLSWLLHSPTVPASGYLATQLALLMAQRPALPFRSGRKLAPLLPCGILIMAQLLCPPSPLLLHICGVLSGLILRYKLLSSLKLSESRARALEKSRVFHYLASVSIVRFIPSREREVVLPETDPRSQERLPFSYSDVSQSTFMGDAPWAGASMQPWYFAGLSDTPTIPVLEGSEDLDEELLRAGIQASLRDYHQEESERQELTLSKSTVSALRLQQLERMGFPTGPAVVALAATGKVERAVSLLVEGEVGGDIIVSGEKQEAQRHLNSLESGQIPP
ncbi:rhomboid domain-containing protein 3 [Rhinophrynus dorsalis]